MKDISLTRNEAFELAIRAQRYELSELQANDIHMGYIMTICIDNIRRFDRPNPEILKSMDRADIVMVTNSSLIKNNKSICIKHRYRHVEIVTDNRLIRKNTLVRKHTGDIYVIHQIIDGPGEDGRSVVFYKVGEFYPNRLYCMEYKNFMGVSNNDNDGTIVPTFDIIGEYQQVSSNTLSTNTIQIVDTALKEFTSYDKTINIAIVLNSQYDTSEVFTHEVRGIIYEVNVQVFKNFDIFYDDVYKGFDVIIVCGRYTYDDNRAGNYMMEYDNKAKNTEIYTIYKQRNI